MAGLLRKALTIRQKQRPPQEPESPTEGLNQEERQEIEAQIEELFRERRLLPDDLLSKRSLKSGVLLPVMVNLLVLLALAAGFWFLVLPNWDTETIARAGGERFETTEGFIVERVRQQAEEELSAQEQRIAEIRRQLEALRQQQSASPSTDNQTAARESELEQELNRLLNELQEQRAEAEAEQGEVASAFEERLNQLQRRQEEQRFLLSQLGYTYQAVDRHLSEGNSTAAIEELNRADQFLQGYSVDGEGAFTNTISILQQGNAALREALELFQGASQVDPGEAERLARVARISGLVENADALMAEGNEAEAEELYRNALLELNATERAFQQLEQMEEARFSEERAQLQAQLEAAREEAAAQVAELRQELAETRDALGQAEAALSQAREDSSAATSQQLAVRAQEIETLRARVSGLETDLENSRERAALLESRIEQRNRAIASLQAEVRSELETVRSAISRELGDGRATSGERLAELLETKTLIREVLSSDAVRREHPELYEEMELYLDALGDSRVAAGRTQGLYGSVVALRELMAGIGIAPVTRVTSSATQDQLRGALAEELSVLVQGVLRQAQ